MINVYDSEDVGHFLTWIYSLFRLVKEEGVALLGAPLGSAEFEAKHIRLKVDKIKDTTALLPLLEDPHTEFVFLRSCLALPKISFLLRAVRAAAAVEAGSVLISTFHVPGRGRKLECSADTKPKLEGDAAAIGRCELVVS